MSAQSRRLDWVSAFAGTQEEAKGAFYRSTPFTFPHARAAVYPRYPVPKSA